MRCAAIALAACFSVCLTPLARASDEVRLRHAPAACIGEITDAWYEGETDRYPHGVLGDAIEWARLSVVVRTNGVCRWGTSQLSLDLSDTRVFEDVVPRVVDLDGDGMAEIITVESDLALGARLTIWGKRGEAFRRVATTPFIGRRNRWLAPVGVADFDGDGALDIAYVDRPHLAKTLRIWRFENDRLTEIAALTGVSNHRIGEDFISGGVRRCAGRPEIVVASGDWSRIMVIGWREDQLHAQAAGPFDGPGSFDPVLRCQ